MMMKTCLVLLCFTLVFAKINDYNKEQELTLRKLLDALEDQNSEELVEERQIVDDDESDELDFDFQSDKRGRPMTKTKSSSSSSSQRVITLENRAAMSARFRVLYSDENSVPFLMESGRLLTQKTKSISIPTTAKVVKVLIDKEMFIDTWHNVSESILDANTSNTCFRIIGTIFSSKVKPCPQNK